MFYLDIPKNLVGVQCCLSSNLTKLMETRPELISLDLFGIVHLRTDNGVSYQVKKKLSQNLEN